MHKGVTPIGILRFGPRWDIYMLVECGLRKRIIYLGIRVQLPQTGLITQKP